MIRDKIKKIIKAGLQPAFLLLPYAPVFILICNLIVLSHFLHVHITRYRIYNYDIDRWWITHFFEAELPTIIVLIFAGKNYSLFGWYCICEISILWIINTAHMYFNFDIANYYCGYLVINGLALLVSAVKHITSVTKHNP